MANALFERLTLELCSFKGGEKRESRNPYLSVQHSQTELNEQNHMSRQLHIFTSSPPPTTTSTQPTSKGLRSQPFLQELVWRDLKDNSNILVPDLEQGLRQNLPVIFGVTGLCLNVTVTKPGQKADSVHPAHVIVSSVSVIHLQSVPLYSSRSPIGSRGQRGELQHIVHCKRINISILRAHVCPNTGDKGSASVTGLYSCKTAGDNETNLVWMHHELWLVAAPSPSPSVENTDKMSHFRLLSNTMHSYEGDSRFVLNAYSTRQCYKLTSSTLLVESECIMHGSGILTVTPWVTKHSYKIKCPTLTHTKQY